MACPLVSLRPEWSGTRPGRCRLARLPTAAHLPLLAALAGAISTAGFARTPAPAAPVQPSATRGIRPNLATTIDRPLRYRPDGLDFVIENGAEFFNRPLYGGHTAFRVDAGDQPEFTLYLPGRGGNLRFGVRAAAGSKWLHETERVIARYRPGTMLYELRDPLLGPGGVVRLAVLALHMSEGLVARIEATGLPSGVELLWAYGGVNGQRDGDIGTENVPISEYFQLRPEYCESNSFTIGPGTFTLHAAPATIRGLVPAGAWQAVADAARWESSADLLASGGQTVRRPVIVGRTALIAGRPLFVALQRVPGGSSLAKESPASPSGGTGSPAGGRGQPQPASHIAPSAVDLPAQFGQTDDYFRGLRERVAVDTPDPFLNAAVAALNVAADAVWDEPSGTVQHGAVAWRSRLLGWRGPYAMDTLGWHDRARRHLTYWAGRQNVAPVPPALPPPDANANLARSEAALHSSGDLSNSHYDMNLVYIDALLRHLLWTGDLGFGRQMWPVIERHLAWERRLFRREFGPDRLPLYEAYAAIWASLDWTSRVPPSTRFEPVGLAQHFNDRVTEIFQPGKYVSPRSPFCSLAIPSQGIGAWAGHVNQMAEIDDRGLREIAGRGAGRFVLPNNVPFATAGPGGANNIVFTSQWDNYPREVTVPLAGRAHHLYLLMAGSTNHMQSRLDNGEVVVMFHDGTIARLALHNPTTWWPIDQDYFIDDFAFARPGPLPPRVDLKTGRVRILEAETFKGTGAAVPGGAATVLHLPLDPDKLLRSLTVRALANEVVIGLMAATLARDGGSRPSAF